MLSRSAQRKNEHLSLFEKNYNLQQKNDFDEIRLVPDLIPELGLKDIKPKIKIFNREFPHSFFINAITGGTAKAKEINQQLATLAQKYDLAMAVGSQKIALKEKDTRDTFEIVRKINPHGFIIANLNANQDISQVKEAIAMINADAIQLHLNSPQELINRDGDRNFLLLNNISKICEQISKPVIIKSVGFGISYDNVKRLQDLGVKYVDVSGKGGTNFIKIENQQNLSHNLDYLTDWGLSTVESLLINRKLPINLIASGGIRNPLDIIKSHALGAKMVGVSGTFLHPLIKKNPEKLDQLISEWIEEIPKIMLMLGKNSIDQLYKTKTILSVKISNFLNSWDKNF